MEEEKKKKEREEEEKEKGWRKGWKEYKEWYEEVKEKNKVGVNTAEGFAKGFLLYLLPFSLLKRGHLSPSLLRRSLGAGGFAGIARGIYQIIKQQNESKKTTKTTNIIEEWLKKYPHAIAGGVGALGAIIIDRSLISSIVVTWLAIRAVRFTFPFSVPFAPTIVMCLSAAQILSAWGLRPRDLNSSYRRFLDFQGGIEVAKMAAIREKVHREGLAIGCEQLHAGQTCTHFLFFFFLRSFLRAAKLYLLFYFALYFLSFHRRGAMGGMIRSIIRSTLFLASYCSMAWASHCLFFRLWPGVTRSKMYLHTWAAGLPTLFERPSRQPDLASYCATYAIDSAYKTLKHKGLVKGNKGVAGAVMVLSMAILCNFHHLQPSLFSSWLLNFS